MTISRTQAAAYLHSRFSRFATEIEQAATDDSATGYGPDIDDALRDLDTDESDLATATVEDSSRRSYFTLLEYYAARRMWMQMSANADSRLDPMSVNYGNVLRSLEAIQKDAAKRLDALGLSPMAEGIGLVRLGLDFIEPKET